MAQQSAKGGEISLSELLIAINDLPWQNEKQLKSMFHALGFNWQNESSEIITSDQQKKIYDRTHYRQKHDVQPPKNNPTGFSIPPTPDPVELPINILSSELKALEPLLANSIEPDFLQKENALLKMDFSISKLARSNLLPNRTNRGILSAALQVKTRGKAIAISQLINQVIKGKLPKTLPRLDCITLQRGCQLLLDYSDSMVPYWEDLTALADQVQDLLGTERVRIFEFDQNPLTAKHWQESGQSTDWLVDTSRPVLLASQLGVSGQRNSPTVKTYWLEFIRLCEQKKVPLLILNPWQESYWPVNLGKFPILIHWNPLTTATLVKKWIGARHEIS